MELNVENNANKKKILIIDDDLFFLAIAETMLSDEYDTLVAQSGQAALIIMVKQKPDLILLDIIMPEMDGWETFRIIKGITLLHEVPIAFLTSVSEEEGLEYAKSVGAVGYFSKPIKKEEIKIGIDKILKGEKLI